MSSEVDVCLALSGTGLTEDSPVAEAVVTSH